MQAFWQNFVLIRQKSTNGGQKVFKLAGNIRPRDFSCKIPEICYTTNPGEKEKQHYSGTPEAIAIAVTIALHRWKHQTLVSITGGTVCYVLLVQLVFA